MNYINHINKFGNSQEIQSALDNGSLEKPYVAMTSAGTLDFNTLAPTPEPQPTMGYWYDDGETVGYYPFYITETGHTYWENEVYIGQMNGVDFDGNQDLNMSVYLNYDITNSCWHIRFDDGGVASDIQEHNFYEGTSDIWDIFDIMTDVEVSDSSLQVRWDGESCFEFQSLTEEPGCELSMTTHDPEYPAGE